MDATVVILSALSGSLVGLSLGLMAGGGSILAVPLMAYVSWVIRLTPRSVRVRWP